MVILACKLKLIENKINCKLLSIYACHLVDAAALQPLMQFQLKPYGFLINGTNILKELNRDMNRKILIVLVVYELLARACHAWDTAKSCHCDINNNVSWMRSFQAKTYVPYTVFQQKRQKFNVQNSVYYKINNRQAKALLICPLIFLALLLLALIRSISLIICFICHKLTISYFAFNKVTKQQ